MAIRTAHLPKDAYRAACLRDARKCSELSEALDMAAEDGDDVESYNTAQIVRAAREALEFYNSGSIATRVAKGDKKAIRERDELVTFIAKWEAVRAERAAWRLQVRNGGK